MGIIGKKGRRFVSGELQWQYSSAIARPIEVLYCTINLFFYLLRMCQTEPQPLLSHSSSRSPPKPTSNLELF